MIKPPCSERGSSTLEFCLLATFLAQMLGGFILVCAFMMAHLWIHHQGQEALICLAEGQRPSVCEAQLRQQIHQVLPFGQVKNVRLSSQRRHWRVSFQWELTSKWHLDFSRRLDRNLKASSI